MDLFLVRTKDQLFLEFTKWYRRIGCASPAGETVTSTTQYLRDDDGGRGLG